MPAECNDCLRVCNKRLAVSVVRVCARLWVERVGKKLVPPMGEKNRTLLLKRILQNMKFNSSLTPLPEFQCSYRICDVMQDTSSQHL